jgi:GTP-binding protein HflX
VLDEIGVNYSNSLIVLNKIDAVSDRSVIDVLRRRFLDSVAVSAVRRTGLDRLAEAVARRLSEEYVDADIETSISNGRLFAYLAEHVEVLDKQYSDTRVIIRCRMPRILLDRLHEEGTSITLLNNGGLGRPADAGEALPVQNQVRLA